MQHLKATSVFYIKNRTPHYEEGTIFAFGADGNIYRWDDETFSHLEEGEIRRPANWPRIKGGAITLWRDSWKFFCDPRIPQGPYFTSVINEDKVFIRGG